MVAICNLVIYFTIYSFIGWLCETIYCWWCDKKLTNRGFLNGPFCPIYGFGALILIVSLSSIDQNYFLVFILGMILTSILEYVTSYFMEKLFHARWWDYSHKKFNIQGRVCLENSILFGIMSVAFISFVHQPVEDLVHAIPSYMVILIASLLTVYLLFDLTITVVSILKFNDRLKQAKYLAELIKSTAKDISIDSGIDFRDKLNMLIDNHKPSHVRILKAFPNMKSVRYSEVLDKIKNDLFNGKTGDNKNIQ